MVITNTHQTKPIRRPLQVIQKSIDNQAEKTKKLKNFHANRAAKVIQKAWKAYLIKRKRTQNLAISLSFCHCYLCYYRKLSKVLGNEKLDECASKIQAQWKGYSIRKGFLNEPNMNMLRMIYRRLIQANCSSSSEMKLANRTFTAISKLTNIKNDNCIISELATLEIASKMSPECCIQIAKEFSTNLISIVNSSNRSEVHKSRIDHGVGILLNIAKYNQASKYLNEKHEVVNICLKFAKIHSKVESILIKCCTLLYIIIKSFTKAERESITSKGQIKYTVNCIIKSSRIESQAKRFLTTDFKFVPYWVTRKNVKLQFDDRWTAFQTLAYLFNL